MTEETRDYPDQVALFRYGLIADLIHLPTGKGSGLYEKLREKADGVYAIPGSRRTRVAAETLRDWLGLYRAGGYDALKPKQRSDIGKARKLPQELIDALINIKEEHRDWTVKMVIDEARSRGLIDPSATILVCTIHRHFQRAGLTAKAPLAPNSKDRRRFSFEHAGELWMSDVMHGPAVPDGSRRKRKTYLIAFLDDATRVIPYAAFAFGETVACFLPVLLQAVERRGVPQRLYVDNGSAYRSHHVALVCARLGITLIHARAYCPQGKGKIERWFRDVRMQLLPKLTAADLSNIDALNRRLWAWVEGEYHLSPHRGLGNDLCPFDAWGMRSAQVRIPGPDLNLREMFLLEQKRRVHKDRTVSLEGFVYEVDAALVGEVVCLRYDPARPGTTVDVWHKGVKVQTARTVDVYANCRVKRDNDTRQLVPSTAPRITEASLRLRDLAERREAR